MQRLALLLLGLFLPYVVASAEAPFVKCTSPKGQHKFQIAPCPSASTMELITDSGSIRKVYPAPPDAIDRVQQQLIHALKDPDSVQYSNIRAVGLTDHPSTWAVCGSFNSKNSYGGYVGYRRFVLIGDHDFYPEKSLGFDVMHAAWCVAD